MTTQAENIIAGLSDEQKLLLADTIVYGGWGDTGGEDFNGEEDYGFVYLPNEAWRGEHFERKKLSAKFKELYKALGMTGEGEWFKTNGVINWHKDWWNDGSCSVIIIKSGLYEELDTWAESYVKQYNSNNQ